MESSIAVFLSRQPAFERLPTAGCAPHVRKRQPGKHVSQARWAGGSRDVLPSRYGPRPSAHQPAPTSNYAHRVASMRGTLLLRLRTVLSKNRHCNRSRTHSLAGFGAARPAARLSVAKPEEARQPAD